MQIDDDTCAACRKCIEICPLKLIKRKAFTVTIQDGCNNCGKCLEICPCGAIIED